MVVAFADSHQARNAKYSAEVLVTIFDGKPRVTKLRRNSTPPAQKGVELIFHGFPLGARLVSRDQLPILTFEPSNFVDFPYSPV